MSLLLLKLPPATTFFFLNVYRKYGYCTVEVIGIFLAAELIVIKTLSLYHLHHYAVLRIGKVQ